MAIIEPPASDDEEEIVKKEIEIDFSHERYVSLFTDYKIIRSIHIIQFLLKITDIKFISKIFYHFQFSIFQHIKSNDQEFLENV